METRHTDVLVIGSGFGAAPPALRLARAGRQVIMVEKGRDINPLRDFEQTQDPQYLLQYLRAMDGHGLRLTYAEGLGGGSGLYEMVSLRAPQVAFDAVDPSGERVWPTGLDRAALDPYYDLAEQMLCVEQIDPRSIPRTGLAFAEMMDRLGYTCERARYAVRGCVGSGFCLTGCIYGAKQSLHLNYLPRAREAGATIETGLEAVEVRPRGGATFRYEVRCRGEAGEICFMARTVVLAGGTLGTAKLLLQSRALDGLGAQVGRNIAFNGSVKAAGLLPEGLEGDLYRGRSHPGVISYHFLDSHGVTVFPMKPLPMQFVAAARLRVANPESTWWGASHAELMQEARKRLMVLVAVGLAPGTATLTRHCGAFHLDLELDDAVRAYDRRTRQLLHSLLSRSGCKLLDAQFLDMQGQPYDDLHFSSAHQVGSCRMADTPERGVVDVTGQVFGHPGLYVTGGAALSGSLAVMPSLTILANAERIAAGMLAAERSDHALADSGGA